MEMWELEKKNPEKLKRLLKNTLEVLENGKS